MPESTVFYVKHDAATGAITAHKMVCYATIAGQTVQVDAMKRFLEQHPHVPISKCVSVIDAGVQRAIVNLKMRGATADAAVHIACKKSPELYSLSLVSGAGLGDKEADGDKTARLDKRKERTGDEQLAAAKRANEQMQRQIENLKKGRAKDTTVKGGPPAGGLPRHGPTCPPGVCKDFNFKSVGCARSPCSFKHVCAECGAEHPWKGNH